MTSTDLSPATVERHQSYEFIKLRERSPGEWSMLKLPNDRLRASVEEYEEKGPSIEGADTREILARLARIGRKEMKQRAIETGCEKCGGHDLTTNRLGPSAVETFCEDCFHNFTF